MAMHRCKNCGSPNVIADSQVGGISYNYLKGAVGTAMLGAGGAVAGLQNQTQTVYKCPDCGMTLSAPMDQTIKELIDLGVVSANARENMSLQGIPVTWEALKQIYKNIEDGAAEKTISLRRRATQKDIDFIVEVAISEIAAIQTEQLAYENGHINYDELHQAWEEASKAVIDRREKALVEAYKYFEFTLQKEISQLQASIKDIKQQEESTTSDLKTEKEALSKKLSSLGMFKFGEKKRIQARIDELTHKLSLCTEQNALHIKSIETKICNARAKCEEKKERAPADIEKKYQLPTNPEKRKRGLEWWQEDKKLLMDAYMHGSPTMFAQVPIFYIIKAMEVINQGKPVLIDLRTSDMGGCKLNCEMGEINLTDLNTACMMIGPKIVSLAGIEPKYFVMRRGLRKDEANISLGYLLVRRKRLVYNAALKGYNIS